MIIYIEDLKFQAIIGILDFERITPQDIIINLTIDYNYKNDFINYAEVASMIESDMKQSKFFLIEDALNHFFNKLKLEFPMIDNLYIKITKPSIMDNCIVSVAENYKFES